MPVCMRASSGALTSGWYLLGFIRPGTQNWPSSLSRQVSPNSLVLSVTSGVELLDLI